MIADVAFDLPLRREFAYVVPPGLVLGPGQRVSAPLQGRARTGVVVALREGDGAGLRAIERFVDPVPLVPPGALDLARWAADESLSSLGSTLLALLPPPGPRDAEPPAAPPVPRGGPPEAMELWLGVGRTTHLLEHLAAGPGSALVIAPDRDAAARWARALEAARLDSGVPEADRRAAWLAAARGRARIVVGTRSALLAPLPPPATLVLLDEGDAGHKPPGPPRMGSGDLLIRRAQADGSRLVLLSAAPSVETWSRAHARPWRIQTHDGAGWPEVMTADTRGVLRNHPLTLPLTRAIEEHTRAGRRVALVVSRRTAALGCSECGALFRCPDCGVSLGHSKVRAQLSCALCGRQTALPETCPACGGHRLSSIGWDAERVEAAVRRRFPRASVSSGDRGAQIAIGAAAMLRASSPGSFGAVGVVALDSLLGLPDFRAAERAFGLLWAAAEVTRPDGRVIVQTLHPEHDAVQAAVRRDRERFYARDLAFRQELGYPPYQRLCLVSARGRGDHGLGLLQDSLRALEGLPGVTVYPPAPVGRGGGRFRALVKGPATLPQLLRSPLAPALERRRRAGGVIEVEMDPVS